jgi:hypothetical protein
MYGQAKDAATGLTDIVGETIEERPYRRSRCCRPRLAVEQDAFSAD